MIILDTNVISELMRRAPKPSVGRWIDRHPASDVFVTAVTAAELRYGVTRLPDGRRKQQLFAKIDGLLAEDFRGQILAFDEQAATCYAQITAARERTGRPISMADAQIAAICRSWTGAELATRNTDDFVDVGVPLVNPWRDEDGEE